MIRVMFDMIRTIIHLDQEKDDMNRKNIHPNPGGIRMIGEPDPLDLEKDQGDLLSNTRNLQKIITGVIHHSGSMKA